jgi:hypothetical protein
VSVSEDDVSQLLMLTADQIDYSSLSVDTLAGIALGGDPYITALALPELVLRAPSRFVEVGWQLLNDSSEDDDTRAFALSLLLRQEPIEPERLKGLLGGAGPDLTSRIEQELDDDPD